MPRRREKDIPIKIGAGGWDGKFVIEKPVLREGYVLVNNNRSRHTSPAPVDFVDAAPSSSATINERRPTPANEITHKIQVEGSGEQNRSQSNHYNRPSSSSDQRSSNANDLYGRASHTTVLPTKWDGTFAPGHQAVRPKQQQHTNTNNFYGYNTEPTVLPAQWDGKFAPGGVYIAKPQQHTNTNNFYGYNTEPTVLPVAWDGKFAQGTEVRIKPETNRSDFRSLYGVSSEPTILPTQWDGKFTNSGNPDNVYMVPERNQSMTNDFYGYNTEPEVLPVQWSGKFQTDPNDVRMIQERNASDVRDYADHRNFRAVN